MGLRDHAKRWVRCLLPSRIMSPSNRPDFYAVMSHRKASLVQSPASSPMILHRPSPCSDFGVTDAGEVQVWKPYAERVTL